MHLNLEFKLKCAVGLPGYFARTFTGDYTCLGSPIVVDSSFVLYLVTLLCTPALAGTKRQVCIFECAVRSLDSAPDVRHPAEFIGHRPNHRTRNAMNWRTGSAEYRANAIGCRLCIVSDKWVYTLLDIPGVHYTRPSNVARGI